MGMDVYGLAPTSERGEYFRNNVWWWRPLWDYCVEIAPELCAAVHGHTNDGDGMDAANAVELAAKLEVELASGRTATYARQRDAELAALPDIPCEHCNATGIRHDQYVDGRCNACEGTGHMRPFATYYPFNEDNVREFAEFCAASGGFKIC